MTQAITENEYTRQEMIRTQKDIRGRLIYMESDDLRRAKRTLRYLESVLNGKEAKDGKFKAIGRCREYEAASEDERAAIACMRARETLEGIKAALK